MDRLERLEALEKRIAEMEHMLVTRLDAIEVQIAEIRQRIGMPNLDLPHEAQEQLRTDLIAVERPLHAVRKGR